MPKISVIVPVYKVEQYLCRCVDSILAQTFTDFELILVDDGSPDNCPAICDEYAQKDNRIVVIHQKNGGLSAARNSGIDIAKGEYLFFVDSDDSIELNALELLYNSLIEHQADIAIGDFTLVFEGDNDLLADYRSPITNETFSGSQAILNIHKRGWVYVVAWGKLYHRTLFNRLRYPIGKLHEDEFIIHELYGRSKKIVSIENQLYNYLQRSNSIMGKGRYIKNLDGREAVMQRCCYLADKTTLEEMKALKLAMRSVTDCLCWECRKFGYNNKELNQKMKSMRPTCKKFIKILMKHTDFPLKERIAVSLLLISPKLYGFLSKLI